MTATAETQAPDAAYEQLAERLEEQLAANASLAAENDRLRARAAEQRADALRQFAREQRAVLDNMPDRERFATPDGLHVDNWHHIFAERAEDMADRIAEQEIAA